MTMLTILIVCVLGVSVNADSYDLKLNTLNPATYNSGSMLRSFNSLPTLNNQMNFWQNDDTSTAPATFRPYNPTLTTKGTYRPTMTTYNPSVFTKGSTYNPVWTSGSTYNPIMTSGSTYNPILTGSTYNPMLTTGSTYNPIMTTGSTYSPIMTGGSTYTTMPSFTSGSYGLPTTSYQRTMPYFPTTYPTVSHGTYPSYTNQLYRGDDDGSFGRYPVHGSGVFRY